MRVLFPSDYCIWSSWSVFFSLSWFAVWGILCPVYCGARQPIALWEGCIQTIANILLADSSCFIYKFVQHTLRHLFYRAYFVTLSDYPQSTGIVAAVGFLLVENYQWPNKLNQFSVWTRYSGWNVKWGCNLGVSVWDGVTNCMRKGMLTWAG